MAEANQPIVIDNGSAMIKAGFAGGDKPRVMLRSLVGRVKHPRAMPGGALETPSAQGGAGGADEVFMGAKAEAHRGALRLQYAMDGGAVQSWADMERLWSFLYARDNLNVASEEHAVLLTEPPLNTYRQRERAAEVFFEALNVPALHCSLQAVLSLYASGRTTGCVLDCGDGVTHVVPVYEGLVVRHAVQRVDLAGRAVTRYLQTLLRRATGLALQSSAELEVVREIKEACCHVALSAAQCEDALLSSSVTGATDSASSSSSLSTASGVALRQNYQLPDGTTIALGAELFRAPELLFQPELQGVEHRGVHDSLLTAIAKCDLDLRRALLSQVVLSGGSTLFPGFGERLLFEMRRHALAPREAKIRIAAPPERVCSTWIGGSILASLSTFKSMWVSRQEYQEQGARVFGMKGL